MKFRGLEIGQCAFLESESQGTVSFLNVFSQRPVLTPNSDSVVHHQQCGVLRSGLVCVPIVKESPVLFPRLKLIVGDDFYGFNLVNLQDEARVVRAFSCGVIPD